MTKKVPMDSVDKVLPARPSATPARTRTGRSEPLSTKASVTSKSLASSTRTSPRTRRNSGETKAAILAAAEVVFATSGYHGASTVGIAKEAKCYESLIFYHYGSKDELFAAVLEEAYRKLVVAEQDLHVNYNDPVQALTEVVMFMWTYYQQHPELIFLLNTENLLKGQHVKQSGALRKFLPTAISVLRNTVNAGIERGVFRPNINVDELYISLMGLGYFYLSNRYTLSSFFGKDLMAKPERERWGQWMVDTIFNAVKKV